MLAVRIGTSPGKVDDHACGGGNLPVHPKAHVFDPAAANGNTALRRCHHRVREIDDDACRRIERCHFGRECALRFELDAQSVLAVRDLELLQRSARGQSVARHVSRIGDQHERRQRNQETQQLLSHFPISPSEAVSPRCVSSKSFSPVLYGRGRTLLYHFTRKRLAQTVLQRLLENYGVARYLHNVTIENGVVLPQKISLVQPIAHDCDESAFAVHYTFQVDGSNLQTLFAGVATGTVCVTHDRTDK